MSEPSAPRERPTYSVEQPDVHRPIIAYPGYRVLSQQDHWDDATKAVIRRRVNEVPPIRFFEPEQARLVQGIVDRILPQDDRPPEQRIPIVPWIDNALYNRIIDGYRFDDLPPNEEAWRLFLQGVEEVSALLHQRRFLGLGADEQDAVLRAIADGHPPGETWQRLPAERFWVWVFMMQLVGVYYAHPIAWDEIGFGGPSYPRGYFALNHGYPEPWETREVRLDAPEG